MRSIHVSLLVLATSFIPGGALTGASAAPEMPLSFERNQGQSTPEVRFLSRDEGASVFLTCSEAVLHLLSEAQPGAANVLRIGFSPSEESCRVQGQVETATRFHYFRGRSESEWTRDVRHYERVRYEGVRPGIDLVFYRNERRLEYDFVLAPGAEPEDVRLTFGGADRLSINESGDLVAWIGGEEIIQRAPTAYQEEPTADGGKKQVLVESRWSMLGQTAAGFEIGEYDRSRPLVIDPVIEYSTYLNGSDTAWGFDVAVDEQGAAYVTGETRSMDFPTTAGAVQPGFVGDQRNGFVAKLTPGGDQLEFATFIGAGGDSAYGVDVDGEGNVYVIGDARSFDFPVTPEAFDSEPDGNTIFVAKFSPGGSNLIYSTFVADGETTAGGIVVDDEGAAYITGRTTSPTFPTVNAVQPMEASQLPDAFVAKLNPEGTALEFSTYWGGADDTDIGEAIALGPDGTVFVAGHTDSTDFPTTAGAFQRTLGGVRDGFLLKLDPDGQRAAFSTLLGGSSRDWAYDVAVDVEGYAYVVGETGTTDGSFPVTPGAMKEEPENREGFVTKFSMDGSGLAYSTLVGGSPNESLRGVEVDTAGRAYVTGSTLDLRFFEEINPAPGALTAEPNGTEMGIFGVMRVDGSGAHTLFGFGGGDGNEEPSSIALDYNCKAYVTGATRSKDFPTVSPVQAASRSEDGDRDAFVTKIDPTTDDGAPTIGCRGVVHATGTPVLRQGSPGAIMTVFGRDFTAEGVQALAPEVDSDGRVAANLANTCVEVDGVRSPIFAVLPGQINFQNPASTALGYGSFRVIRGCGTADEQASEPERIKIMPTTPAFFNFVNNGDGVNPIAALHQDGARFVGPSGLFGDAVETTPAAPGEFVSLFAGGFGATNPSFQAGEIPGVQATLVSSDVQVTIGGVLVPPGDVFYIGVAPCCAGLYQLVVRIPPELPNGAHQVVVTIDGYSSPVGPFVQVEAP